MVIDIDIIQGIIICTLILLIFGYGILYYKVNNRMLGKINELAFDLTIYKTEQQIELNRICDRMEIPRPDERKAVEDYSTRKQEGKVVF